MRLSRFSVSGTLLHAWSHSAFFPHFAVWKKGQSKGFMLLHTGFHICTCFFKFFLFSDALCHVPSSSLCLSHNSVCRTIRNHHYCFWGRWLTFACWLCPYTFGCWRLVLREMCACWREDFVSYNDTAKGITKRMWPAYQLCPNICSSLCERVAELRALPHFRGPLGKWMGLISWEGPAQPD